MFIIDAYGCSDRGKVREVNEDMIGVFPDKRLFVIADGMGGYSNGDKASTVSVAAVVEYFSDEVLSALSDNIESCRSVMSEAVQYAHGKILDTKPVMDEGMLLGSTIIIAFLHETYLHICHVGDSRVYIINPSGITQLTDDHSTVGNLVRMGKLSPQEARVSPLRNEVSQALGSPSGIRPDYRRQPLCDGDTVLLCTDGLWEMVDDRLILEFFRTGGKLEQCCSALINAANTAGGEDNISVIAVKVEESNMVSSID